MSIPITDMISGSPAGAAPQIRTLAKSQDRRRIRARTIVVVQAGATPPEHCALFVRGHGLRCNPASDGTFWDLDLRYPVTKVDIYRSRRNEIDAPMAARNIGWRRAEGFDQELTPIHPLEREYLAEKYLEAEKIRNSPARKKAERQLARKFEESGEDETVPLTSPERLAPFWLHEILDDEKQLDEYIRRERGDLNLIGWWDSPWDMTCEQASEAGILRLATDHLYCGVREEHGRWQYYRGLGSHLTIEGTADTQAEAEMMARAHLFRAWLERVNEIEDARRGDLSWGWPVPSPVNWQTVGDPQKNY